MLVGLTDLDIVGIGGAQGTVERVDVAEFNHDFHYNVTSMIQMAGHAVTEMRKTGRGAIVNMSSVCGLTGGSPSVFYPTAKGAIVQMTRAMAGHHGPDNIRVNCVCPGMAYTPMARSRGMTEDMRHERKNLSFLKYEGTAWDIGNGGCCFFPGFWIAVLPMLILCSYHVPRQSRSEMDHWCNLANRWRCKSTYFPLTMLAGFHLQFSPTGLLRIDLTWRCC